MSDLLTSARQTDDLAARAAKAASVWDFIRSASIIGPEGARMGALVENIIAAIQGSIAPSEWGEVGAATVDEIIRRCEAPSAVGAVLLQLRPAVAVMGNSFRGHHLGTDKAGRGAGWERTNNGVNIAEACNDAMAVGQLNSGHLFRALKDIVIAAIQGGYSQPEWAKASRQVGETIRKRMVAR